MALFRRFRSMIVFVSESCKAKVNKENASHCFQPFAWQNVSIGIVGKDMEFTIYDDDDVAPFLEGLEERPQRKVSGSDMNK